MPRALPEDKDILGQKANLLSTGDLRGNDSPPLLMF